MLNTIHNKKILAMFVLSVLFIGLYLLYAVNMKFFDYAMYIRTPKLFGILIASFCIGSATIVFQSLINNRIVTPCLLGMNSLYILIHTAIAFIFGVTSIFSADKNISFIIDIVLMSVISTFIYGLLFKKTNYNILYILLSGTIMATFFTSISNTLLRGMDPNQYDMLLTSLVAGFSNINSDILVMSVILMCVTLFIFRNEIKLLDVITLGKNQAINLGVDYDRVVSKLLIAVTIFITIATALVGPISFLGLIIANVARELMKTYRHTYLMLASVLTGMIVLLVGQFLIEHVFEFNAMISVFINLFGGIYFLYLIISNKTM